jgi:putative sterol carrier protein
VWIFQPEVEQIQIYRNKFEELKMQDAAIQDLMNRMQGAFLADKAKGIDTVVQFDISGENGGKWVVTIQNQECKVVQGTTPNPKLSLISDEQTVLAIFTGKLSGTKAYMQGRIRLVGNLSLALKLIKLFKVD